ncbi:MAG TPA: HEPN domain-containing protein [Thermoplasmatales archaeon]|nr:HEPN domain-containing protein [Thermoplasmatales archaeon]
MNFEECLRRNLIRKDENAMERVEKSLGISNRFLESARKNLEIEEYEMAEIAAYNAIFHVARALLFSKGYVERSHACLIVALKHLYRDDLELIEYFNAFDRIRLSRHNIQYGGITTDKCEAEYVLNFARKFLETVKGILNK